MVIPLALPLIFRGIEIQFAGLAIIDQFLVNEGLMSGA